MEHPRLTLRCDGIEGSPNGVTHPPSQVKSPDTSSSVQSNQPDLLHRLRAKVSILTILISRNTIFAGTQEGELIVWSLETYEELTRFRAHRGSVLSLCLFEDGQYLFSSGADAIVNVWSSSSLDRAFSIYSSYDVGDVFCVVYSSLLQTVYLGAQNTSIQWYDLSKKDTRPAPDPTSHPSHRNHRFFDSKDRSGRSTPRPQSAEQTRAIGGQELQIERDHIVQFAHYGYVYCMLLTRSLNSPHRTEVLISGGGDGSIKLWSLNPDGEEAISELKALENGDASVLTLALVDALLYSGKLEGHFDVWDLETYQLVRRVRAYSEDILTLSVGHELIFTGSGKGNVKIFNNHHAPLSLWQAHEHLILASAVTSINGRDLYVTGGNDGCVSVWDVSRCSDRPKKVGITDNEEMVLDLAKFVSFQSISSRPEYVRDCHRGASFLKGLFKRFGARTELIGTGHEKNPIVYARFSKPSAGKKRKTLLFYGHYDVVSADQGWTSDPFILRKEGGHLYGRGVSDNKGPVLAALYAVADVLKADKLEIDIVFLVEGEEESGSRGFQSTIREHKDLIGKIDWILLANSYWLTDDIPCLTYGLRGIIRATISVKRGGPDLHSGVDGSCLLNEPMKDLISLLSDLTQQDGRVRIPDFYNAVPSLTADEKGRLQSIVRCLLQKNPGIGGADGLISSFQAKWCEPSLTIHRVHASGSASSSVIPHTAHGDVSIRLVPNQTTKSAIAALQRYVATCFGQLNSSNTMTIKIEHQAEPWLGDPTNYIFKILESAVSVVWGRHPSRSESGSSSRTKDAGPQNHRSRRSNAWEEQPKSPPMTSTVLSSTTSPIPALGKENVKPSNSRNDSKRSDSITMSDIKWPLFIREGGSIPAIRFLEQEFDAPAAHLPCGQASDNAHLDNERLRVTNLYNSREILKKVFMTLGKSAQAKA